MSSPFLYRGGSPFRLLPREAPSEQVRLNEGNRLSNPMANLESPPAEFFRPGIPNISLMAPSPETFRSQFGYRLFTHPWGEFIQLNAESLRNLSPQSLLSVFPTWRQAVQNFANHFLSVDLDMLHMPINNGQGITRFSEWASRDHAPRPPLVEVRPGTTARGHGEIRPMAGLGESWITRVNVDFTPDVTYLLNTVPDLYIQEFAAVDPPRIIYDWENLPDSPVIHMRGGNLEYENPTQSGGPATTPFGSVRQPPPGNHDYWMFHFNPLRDSLAASLEELVADGGMQDVGMTMGLGALNLWAFLPTLGIDNPRAFEDLGIPFNTFPRRFGDLIELLWPLFTSERVGMMQSARLINPNTEYYARHYLDARGRPQLIPEDPDATYTPHYELRHYLDASGSPHRIPSSAEELTQLNETRTRAGLESVRLGRWLPIPGDEESLATLNEHREAVGLPELTFHRRRRIPTDPHEVLRLDRQIRALNTREDVELPLIPRNRGSVVDWIGLALARDPERLAATPADELPQATFRAQMRDFLWRIPFGSLQINEETQFTISYRLNRVTDPDSGATSPQYALSLRFHPLDLGPVRIGVNEYTRLLIQSVQANAVTIEIPNLSDLGVLFEESELSFTERLAQLNASVHLEGVEVTGLRFGSEAFTVGLTDGTIERLTFRASGSEWRMAMRGLRAGNLSIESEAPPTGTEEAQLNSIILQLHAPGQRQDLFIYQDAEGMIHTRMAIEGGIETGALTHTEFGTLQFTTLDADAETRVPQNGQIRLSVDPNQPRESLQMRWDIPYLGIWTGPSAPLRMDQGDSHIREAHVEVSPEGVELEGLLDLNARMPQGLGDGPTQLFESGTSLDSRVEDLQAEGRFSIRFRDGGMFIEGPDPDQPLNLNFSLADATFHNEPANLPDYVRRLPAREIIQTDVGITQARVSLENFRRAHIERVETDGESRRRLTQLASGPLTVSDIQGQGSIWVNLLIWGFVRGLFPHLGDLPGGGRSSRRPAHPDLPERAPLLEALSPEIRAPLEQGDFLRIGGVRVEREVENGEDSDEWTTELNEVLLHLHEEGGRDQFGLIRIPQLRFGNQDGQVFWEIDPNFLINVFLNSPPRGGSFRFVRWPQED